MQTKVGYANQTPVKLPEWHSLIAWDMFFNNLTTGLFLVAAACELVDRASFQSTTRWAFALSLIFLTADLVCLVLDLGDPLRFHHMLRVFKPSSPMSLGTWCLTVYSLPLTLIVAIDLLLQGKLPLLRWLCVWGGLLPALGSAVYKGVLISTNSQAGWKDARWLGGYLANSAVMIGCAALLLIAAFAGQSHATTRLQTALVVLIFLNFVVLILLALDVREAFSRLYSRDLLIGFAGLYVVSGVLVPVGLLLSSRQTAAILFAVSLLLLMSLVVRFYLVKLPHSSH